MNQKTASAPAAENKMGTMPIGRLLFNMSLPMMVSMLVQALYNIVDSIFVAKLSENALTAVSLAFPLQMLLIAVATGTGVGMNALLSRALGAKQNDEANKIASNAAFLYIISYIVFLILGFTVVKPFYASQIGNVDVEIMEMGIDYLSTVMIFSMGLLAQICFERLLTSTGRTIFSMTSQLCGAITNIILDPILIFGLIGFPKMGVTGAALATVIGQCVGALVAFICNHKFNPDVKLQFRGFRPDGRIIRTIYAIGIPSIIMQSIGSVMTYSMNRILITFSSTATAVFGVYFKLQSFFFMPVFGLNNGITPIIAFNYGARIENVWSRRSSSVWQQHFVLCSSDFFALNSFHRYFSECSTHLLICLRLESLRFVSSVSITYLHGSASSAVLYSRRLERPCSV